MLKKVAVNGLKSGMKFDVLVSLVKPLDKSITIVSLDGVELGRIERVDGLWWYCITGETFFVDFITRQECISAIVRGTFNDYPERIKGAF
jgi:hypothetical protein